MLDPAVSDARDVVNRDRGLEPEYVRARVASGTVDGTSLRDD